MLCVFVIILSHASTIKKNKKAEGFKISHHHWSFSSDFMAEKELTAVAVLDKAYHSLYRPISKTYLGGRGKEWVERKARREGGGRGVRPNRRMQKQLGREREKGGGGRRGETRHTNMFADATKQRETYDRDGKGK